jgi:hypothetical protein
VVVSRQIVVVLVVAVSVVAPARGARRIAMQDRTSRASESRQQSDEGQGEDANPEDASSMTTKIMECRSILQQAGMIDPSAGRTTEGQPENETEEPKGADDRMETMNAPSSRRNARKY